MFFSILSFNSASNGIMSSIDVCSKYLTAEFMLDLKSLSVIGILQECLKQMNNKNTNVNSDTT